ncbi:hypothetical protein LL038_09120 [Clostridium estertheticum]|uniref:Uncharacterized protein n=1 Tax=Clostridium estertheticum TaxID=238834 RepID=A0AA47I896_9CLOT|nr:hypothetical protein [Clostridium estertheticum]MBU3155808.1 hypothetical protein [Clostridium estertheticum]WAG62378.1 hypothetical protein LL038_09120 [Clostridium estertheticum]
MKQIKKLSNDNFFIKWKPIHEKGIIAYEIRNTVPLILFIILINSIYLIRYPMNTEAHTISIRFSALIVLIFIVSSVLKWFNFEKRYTYIKKVYEENI